LPPRRRPLPGARGSIHGGARVLPSHPGSLPPPARGGGTRAGRLRARGLPSAGPEVRGESRARARLPRRAGAGGAGGAPRGERVRGLLAARSRRRARRRAAGRARLLLLVRFGRRERRLLVRRDREGVAPGARTERAEEDAL